MIALMEDYHAKRCLTLLFRVDAPEQAWPWHPGSSCDSEIRGQWS